MSSGGSPKTTAFVLFLALCFVSKAAQCQQKMQATEADIEALVDKLRLESWQGPRNFTSPIHWVFNFTPPMLEILDAGSAAEPVLLRHLADEGTKDQVIILLGGVGSIKSVKPIIDAMADENEQNLNPEAKKRNLIANIALTNITAAEVIWGRCGGIPFARCPNDPKGCWSEWWKQNRDRIEKEIDVNRNYVNYPNYGIYEQRKHENSATHANDR